MTFRTRFCSENASVETRNNTDPEPHDMPGETRNFLGFDIGGTKIAVCVGNSSGDILAADRLEGATNRPYRTVMPELIALGNRLIDTAGLTRADIDACGISAPGPMDVKHGILEKSPNMVWADVPIRDDLAAAFGLPTVLENDGNAGALVEWFFGAGKGCRDLIYFTMSTGIGGGIIANGQLVRGAIGNAGELGHAILDIHGPVCGCGMRGCFEAFCSGRNVALQLQELAGHDPQHPLLQVPGVAGDASNLGYPTLREAVRAGIPVAEEFWDSICLRMAQGLGLYLMAFNPEVIVLGTVFYHSGDLLMDPVKRYLPRFCWPKVLKSCRLELPGQGSTLGEMSGIAVALYDLYEKGRWTPDWESPAVV